MILCNIQIGYNKTCLQYGKNHTSEVEAYAFSFFLNVYWTKMIEQKDTIEMIMTGREGQYSPAIYYKVYLTLNSVNG